MKNAGKACNNRLYRHIRTFEKIIKNYFVILQKKCNGYGTGNAMEYYDKAIASKICCIFIKICYNIGKYIILFFTSFRMYDFLFLPRLFFCGI